MRFLISAMQLPPLSVETVVLGGLLLLLGVLIGLAIAAGSEAREKAKNGN